MQSGKPYRNIDNYTRFINRSSKIMEMSDKNDIVAVMYIDITGFQLVNDFYGFKEGDRFLKACGDFLSSLPGTEVCTRVFSDHFLWLARFENECNTDYVIENYEKVMKDFIGRQRVFHANCRVSLSCGYCVVEQGENGLTTAIDDANHARKEAKNTSRTCINCFNDKMRRKIKERKDMEIGIQSALIKEEFIFYLQPKVNLYTGKVVGSEALARWRKADGTIVYPDAFIPIMEQNGSIIELDFLIYRKVCIYLKEGMEQGKKMLPISVNMSRMHIFQSNFADRLHKLASDYRIPPELLEFEVTETLLLEEFEYARKVINEIRGYGYKISIDDFGSGFTGVNIWKNLDFDVVKLDKGFICSDEEKMLRNDIILTSINYVGKMRRTALLCEGVETIEQCRHMKELGCEIAQGYYFMRPVGVEEFEEEMDRIQGYYPLLWLDADNKKKLYSVEEWEQLSFDNYYREIYDSVDCGIIQYRKDEDMAGAFRCVNLNQYAAKLYGFQTKEDALTSGMDIVNDFLIAEDEKVITDKIGKLKYPGESALLDFRIRGIDGRIKFITGTVKVILDRAGEKIYLAVLVDNSEAKEMERLKDRLNMVMENTPGDVIVLKVGESDYKAQYLTMGLARTFGYSKEEFERRIRENGDLDLVYQPDKKDLLRNLFSLAKRKAPLDINFRAIYKDGTIGWHNLSADYCYYTEEGYAVYHGIITNISKLKRQEEALVRSDKRYRIAVEMVNSDIWSYNFEEEMLYLPVSEELSQLSLNGKTKVRLEEFLQSGNIHPDYINDYLSLYDQMKKGERDVQTELLAKTKNNNYEWFIIHCKVTAVKEDGSVLEMVGIAKNIDKDKRREEKLDELKDKAARDSLTGFYNRDCAQMKIQEKLDALPGVEKQGAFLLLDIDNFKRVNDSFGHQAGDQVLQKICGLIQNLLPEDSIAGRLGGDEFIMFITNFHYESDIYALAYKICDNAHSLIFEEEGKERISVSIGIAFAKGGDGFTELYGHADEAMYQVKNGMKNGYGVWDNQE